LKIVARHFVGIYTVLYLLNAIACVLIASIELKLVASGIFFIRIGSLKAISNFEKHKALPETVMDLTDLEFPPAPRVPRKQNIWSPFVFDEEKRGTITVLESS